MLALLARYISYAWARPRIVRAINMVLLMNLREIEGREARASAPE